MKLTKTQNLTLSIALGVAYIWLALIVARDTWNWFAPEIFGFYRIGVAQVFAIRLLWVAVTGEYRESAERRAEEYPSHYATKIAQTLTLWVVAELVAKYWVGGM